MNLRVVLAQINTTVGDLRGNREAIVARLAQARAVEADIVVFPEMSVTGYPAEDLLLKPDFVARARESLGRIAPATLGMTAIVGCLDTNRDLHNAAAILHDGVLVGCYHKHFLPNYGVFDENRYFRSGSRNYVYARSGVGIGVSICEDIWYPGGPPEVQAYVGGAELLVNISASPYHVGKGAERERMLATRAADNIAFVVYCNLVGGQDELVFDGHSLICDPMGNVVARGKQFDEDLLVADLDMRQVFRARLLDPRLRKLEDRSDDGRVERIELTPMATRSDRVHSGCAVTALLEPDAEVYSALVLGTRDYIRKTGFRDALIGLSGGIDSSLTAVIAADCLGPDHVTGIAMPTRYSSTHSLEDAEALARNVGMKFVTLPIDVVFQAFLDALAPVFAGMPADVTEENIQPRVRGTLLMALSNKLGSLVLTTGNKSEVGVGYSTLYGDTAGGFAVIKDVPKELVYKLCRYRNRIAGRDLIPLRVLNKPPSAELRPDQKDSDSLPEYPVLDPILQAYVEESCSLDDLLERGPDRQTIQRIIRLVDRSEYKRRQSPPGVKITPRAFGKDWRLPIANRYRPDDPDGD